MSRVPLSDGVDGPQIGVYSFGTQSSDKPVAQYEFDVSKLRDPQGQQQFKNRFGWDLEVRDWMKEDSRLRALVQDCRLLAADLLGQRPKGSGAAASISTWTSFSFKDFHGRWISPAVAELVADALSADGWRVTVHHREQGLVTRKETTGGGRTPNRAL